MRPRALLLAALGPLAALAALAPAALAGELVGLCDGDLCAVSEGGAVTRLTDDAGRGDAYSSPSLSRDGSVLGYIRGGTPYRAGRRGAGPEPVLQTADAEALSVSPDGRTVLIRTSEVTADFDLAWTLVLAGALGPRAWSGAWELADPGWAGGRPLVTAPDADLASVVCRPALAPSGAAPPCGAPVARAPGVALSDPVGTADGRTVVAAATAVATDERRIAAFDAATGAPLRTLSAGPFDSTPSLSPDGTQVAFTREADTWIVPLAGGPERLLARGVVDAAWGGSAAAGAGGRSAGRPQLVPGSLRGRGRLAVLRARCLARAGCSPQTWTLRRGRRLVGRVAVPALRRGASVRLRMTLRRRDAGALARVGPRGLRVVLSGAGPDPEPVRLRRAR
ncbi:MAG TPA: hypothetical protein VHK23_11125 [Miltoncostaeaceae bacterium]|nr:hypothetical protein [Miltoncostaeaceae bacterium]